MEELFNEPIYTSRPLLPNLENVNRKMMDIWESKWLTNNGVQQKTLEKELKNYLNVEHLSLFTNGTLALLLGLKSLDIKGEVITTPFTISRNCSSS